MLHVIQDAKSSLDPTSAEEFGNGFLMRRGTTLIWLGWQWDVRNEPGQMRLYAPVAKGADGKPITGLVRSDFIVDKKVTEQPLGHMISGRIGGPEYACSDPNDPANVLTVREAPLGERRTIPRKEWPPNEQGSSLERYTRSSIARRIRWWPGSASRRCAISLPISRASAITSRRSSAFTRWAFRDCLCAMTRPSFSSPFTTNI